MADVHEPETRSYNMSQIQAKDTKPEMMVRKALHRLGYRYTLHKSSLPGKPDLYFKKYNAVIEINGCFWHGHDCHLFKMPKSNKEYWIQKIQNNKKRDDINAKKILELGIRYLVIWECALKGKGAMEFEKLVEEVTGWLNSTKDFRQILGK